MGGGAPSKSPCLWNEPSRHGQQARLFAKRLGHFLEPGAARPLKVATAARSSRSCGRRRAQAASYWPTSWVLAETGPALACARVIVGASPGVPAVPAEQLHVVGVAIRAAHQQVQGLGPV